MTSTSTNNTLQAALDYGERGWRVAPLHDVSTGTCSCKRDCGNSAGKHPRIKEWTRMASWDPADIRMWWRQWPTSNVCVVMGEESGLWALDLDGEEGVAQMAAMQLQEGDLPLTPHFLTGGGGMQYLFRWPTDGSVVLSGSRLEQRPIDTRGRGGQSVMPPSVSGKGPYRWLISPDQAELAEAPHWLLDWLRQNGRIAGGVQPTQPARIVPTPNGEWSAERRAIAYLERCPPAISGQNGSGITFTVARAVVWGFDLGPEQGLQLLLEHYNPRCVPPWSEKELRHKCQDADTRDFNKPRGYLLHAERPAAEESSQQEGHGERQERDESPIIEIRPDDVATIHDLVRAGSEIRWAWQDWIQVGVLNAIAGVGGAGKTRFCADLVRRISCGMDWPDGRPMNLPRDTLSLWMLADNHHDEMVSLARSFGIVDSVRINASKSDPYGGVSLESLEDYTMLEARIRAIRPAFVIIDTVGNATDKNLSKQEDAKSFYAPLQIIARKYRTSILCLTHLNASGQFLGRRVLEKVRIAIKLDQYEGEERQRLEVIKSNSVKPPAMGVTRHSDRNEYDCSPPEPPQEGVGKQMSAKLQQAVDWLRSFLSGGPQRVSYTRTRAENDGISNGDLYRAKQVLLIEERLMQGYKWWELPNSGPEE